jgi:hypothetical protein
VPVNHRENINDADMIKIHMSASEVYLILSLAKLGCWVLADFKPELAKSKTKMRLTY